MVDSIVGGQILQDEQSHAVQLLTAAMLIIVGLLVTVGAAVVNLLLQPRLNALVYINMAVLVGH